MITEHKNVLGKSGVERNKVSVRVEGQVSVTILDLAVVGNIQAYTYKLV